MQKIACLFLMALGMVASLLCFSSPDAYAKNKVLNIGFGHGRAPYIIFNGGNITGIEVDVLKEAFALKGYEIEPYALSNEQVTRGYHKEIDAIAGADKFPDSRPIAQLSFSNSHLTYNNVAISRKSANIDLKNFDDLRPYRVSAWSLAHRALEDDFKEIHAYLTSQNRYYEFENQKLQIKSFILGKADVMLLDYNLFQYYAKVLRFEDPVDVHYIFSRPNKTYVSFLDKNLRDEFNDGLRQLRESGRYQEIIDNYTH